VIPVESLEAAEFTKLAGMIYRDVNIALANELAEYAAAIGVNFEAVREAANTDGEAALLVPGIGVGGHCTPVYPHFALSDAKERGIDLGLTRVARERNASQPERVVERIALQPGDRALILGVGFRPEVREAAFSPAFAVREALLRRGVRVEAHDPLYTSEELQSLGFTPGIPAGQEIVILVTAHPSFGSMDLRELAASGTRVIVDGRGIFDPAAVKTAGMAYVGVVRTPDSAPNAHNGV
jgi:nucleotide sugar dehydrogenase